MLWAKRQHDSVILERIIDGDFKLERGWVESLYLQVKSFGGRARWAQWNGGTELVLAALYRGSIRDVWAIRGRVSVA